MAIDTGPVPVFQGAFDTQAIKEWFRRIKVFLDNLTLTSAEITDFAEATSDQVGTMVTGNTETGITVTYDDADNTLDFSVTAAGLGLGTCDSPQFTAVNIGHATDTTITRVEAGALEVEGIGLLFGGVGVVDGVVLRADTSIGVSGRVAQAGVGLTNNDDGSVVNTLQPCFQAQRSADVANITGAGGVYTIICDTEIKDQGGDYNATTGVLTVPVGGSYQLSTIGAVGVITPTTADDLQLTIVTSNRTYAFYMADTNDIPAEYYAVLSQLCDMDANDTAYVTVAVSGMAGNTSSLRASGSQQTKFQGVLMC